MLVNSKKTGHPEEAGAKRSATEEPALRSASDVGIALAPRLLKLLWMDSDP